MKMRKTCAGFAALALIAVAVLSVHGQPAPGVAPKNAVQQLVILDTDIGDDIDDAFALALLLESPEIKLLGISTAFGDTELRARALLASGVPVFMMPLDSTQIHLTARELGTIFSHGSPLSDQLTLLYHQWTGVEAWGMPTLFDPVAASYAIRPELCPTKPMHLEVDDQGFTKPGTGEPNAQVCLKADEQGFREFLLKRILSDSEK